MLLSNNLVGFYLKQNYVLCWNSLRPVPKVTIDFGNGRVLERTIKGNTAFHLCRADGTVVDSFPGVMEPEGFMAALEASRPLARATDEVVLARHKMANREAEGPKLEAISKAVVEAPLVKVLEKPRAQPAVGLDQIVDLSARPARKGEVESRYLPGKGSLTKRALAADSEASFRVLRPAVHSLFARWGHLPSLSEFRGPLFKEVLQVDLDDPYLGLKVEDIPGT